jgi:hypothetical protein
LHKGPQRSRREPQRLSFRITFIKPLFLRATQRFLCVTLCHSKCILYALPKALLWLSHLYTTKITHRWRSKRFEDSKKEDQLYFVTLFVFSVQLCVIAYAIYVPCRGHSNCLYFIYYKDDAPLALRQPRRGATFVEYTLCQNGNLVEVKPFVETT